MKKSLLSLALATLATTALANTVLFESYSKELTLAVDGSAAYDFSHQIDTTKQRNPTNGFYEKQSYKGNRVGEFDFKLATTFTYENPESFKFGFTGELGSDNTRENSRTNDYLNNVRTERTDADYTESKEPWKVKATKAEVFASHDLFGSLVFGKTDTLVDQFAGTSLNTLEVDSDFLVGETDSKLAVVYTLPSFVENLSLQYGYAANLDEKGYRQNTLKATYYKFGAEFALGAVYNNNYRNGKLGTEVSKKASSYQVSVSSEEVPYLKNFSVTALYAFSKVNSLDSLKVVTEKKISQSALFDFKYEGLNDLVTPYTGIFANKVRTKTDASFQEDKSYGAYVGLESTYKLYADASATVYLEGSLTRATTTAYTNAQTEQKTKTHTKAFAAGVKLSF